MKRGKFQIEIWDAKQKGFIINSNKRNRDHAIIAAETLRDSASRKLQYVRIINIEEKETVFYYRRGKSKLVGTVKTKPYLFDLDGVIRHLIGSVHKDWMPKTWDEPLPNGYDFCRYIDRHLDFLATCPPTLYYDVIRRLPHIEIVTHQPEKWKQNTIQWIEKHFETQRVTIHFVNSPMEKMQFLTNGHKIVEDYPYFKDYSRVVLIDWPCNRNVVNPFMRNSDPKQ